jgi:photosynthetic reaction center cytochrome c subunit
MKFGSRRTIIAIGTMIGCLLCVALAVAQAGQQPKPQMAEEVFKNIPVLKGVPVDEFMDTMGMFSAATSMNCTDCHTSDSTSAWENYAKDTDLKRTARRMTLMMNNINRQNFNNDKKVTCYTCHRGSQRPEAVPSLTVQYGVPLEDPNAMEIISVPGGPTVDQVFNKYIQAVGGAQRAAALTSFVAKGTYAGYDTDHAEVPTEIYVKAPNQRTSIVHALFGDKVQTYDGREGWAASPDKPVPLMGLTKGNLEGARIDAIVSFPTQIRQAYSNWKVGIATLDDKDVTVMQGTSPGMAPVNLYFDESGLLVRLVRFSVTLVGTIPTQLDFTDYRDVAGVKVPFNIVTTWTNGQTTTKLTEVQPNVAIPATRFAKPAPAPPPKLQ